jgi:hypothetical protein
MIRDPNTKKLLALYMAVRAVKVWADLKQQEGKYSQKGMDMLILACAIVVSVYFSTMYVIDHKFWPESTWQAVGWIFNFNN